MTLFGRLGGLRVFVDASPRFAFNCVVAGLVRVIAGVGRRSGPCGGDASYGRISTYIV